MTMSEAMCKTLTRLFTSAALITVLSSCSALPSLTPVSVPVGYNEGTSNLGVGKYDVSTKVSDVEVKGDMKVQSIPFSTLAFGVLGWTIAGGLIGYSLNRSKLK